MIDSIITLYNTILATITSDIANFNLAVFGMLLIIFWITKFISSRFESDFFRFIILGLGLYFLSSILEFYSRTFIFNLKFYVAFGLLLPHKDYYFYTAIEKYYQMKYASINTYYFSITIYYKTIRLIKALVWFVVSFVNLGIYISYLIKNTFTLFSLGFKALYEKVKDTTSQSQRKAFKQYWRWFKEDWDFQQEQRAYAKYEYREWYKGTKFYYNNPNSSTDSKQDSDSSYSNNQKSSENEDWQKNYEEWFRKHKSSEQKENYQSSQDNNRQNKSDENNKSSNKEYARFFEGDYYTILGVQQTASFNEIKKAWKDLVNTYHPDRNPDNEELYTKITQKINEAYDYFKKKNKNS